MFVGVLMRKCPDVLGACRLCHIARPHAELRSGPEGVRVAQSRTKFGVSFQDFLKLKRL